MRIAIFLASVLVLSGCASAEPREEIPVASQVTEQEASDTETQDDAEVAEMESAEPESSETTAEESEEGEEVSGESAETRETEQSEPEESEQEASDESEQEESVEQENESAESDDDSAQEPEATEEPSPSPAPEETTVGYTLAQVSQRDSAAECWVAIDGGVYDLTSWIRSHPGGSGAILNLCGKDGTSSFTSQHGGQARPTSTLDGYYIAPLVG